MKINNRSILKKLEYDDLLLPVDISKRQRIKPNISTRTIQPQPINNNSDALSKPNQRKINTELEGRN